MNIKVFCIEYNIHDCEEQFIKNSCYPVRYDDDYDYTNELLDIKLNKFKILMEPLLKKSTEWSYEEEWRLLFDYNTTLQGVIKVGSKYFVKLPKPRAIYLGCNILEKNKNKILSICKDREIMVHQMEMNKKNHQLKDEKILLKYSRYYWNEPDFIKECIVNKNYKNLIKNYFYPNNRNPDLNKLISVFSCLDEKDIMSFLDELLFKNEIFPVLHYYFYNVLLFLNELNNNVIFKNLKTKDGLNIESNIRIWLKNCLSNFYENKIIRYMIFYEKLFMRFYNRYVILDDDEKEYFESKLMSYSIKNDYVTLINNNESNMKLIHPYCNIQMQELIKDNIIENLQIMRNTFYKNGIFNEISCYIEYLNLDLIVNELEKYSQKKYDIIYENSSLPFSHEWIFNETYDNLLWLTCKALKDNSELLKLLSSKDKNLIKDIGTIFFNGSDIVNLIFKCCELLNLNYKIKINDKNLILNYFNPLYDPYNLIY